MATKPNPDKVAAAMLIAYMAFKQPNKIRMAYLIPRDKAAWLEYLVRLTKTKTVVKYLSDKELRKVILRARPSLQKKKYNYPNDHDAPPALYWTVAQVADWIGEIGYPHLKDAFRENYVNGKKLIEVDASALNKMGLRKFEEIKNVAIAIREVLEVNRPNILRAIARKVPLKLYLQQRVHSGRTYDLLTFKKFCETNGFPYEIVATNKCALIAGCCSVLISPVVPIEQEVDSSGESSGSSTDLSLANAPSVEFLVRHQVVRNRTIENILEALMERFWDPKYKRMYGAEADRIMQRILDDGFLELGFGDPESYTKEKVEFATKVSEDLIRELLRCVDILNDMNKLREELKGEEVSPEYYDNIRMAAENFLENSIPIAASLMLGALSLENIFREQPEFVEFVNSVASEAERRTNEQLPLAELLVDHVLSEAKLRVMVHDDFPYSSVDAIREARLVATDLVDELINDTNYITNSLRSTISQPRFSLKDLTPEKVRRLRFLRRGITHPEEKKETKEEKVENAESGHENFPLPEVKKSEMEMEWIERPHQEAEPSRPATATDPITGISGLQQSESKVALV